MLFIVSVYSSNNASLAINSAASSLCDRISLSMVALASFEGLLKEEKQQNLEMTDS